MHVDFIKRLLLKTLERIRRSPQGLWDLLGNVSEWVRDDYVADYEDASAQGEAFCDQDLCDAQGEKVYRGGGWRTFSSEVNNRTRYSVFLSAQIGRNWFSSCTTGSLKPRDKNFRIDQYIKSAKVLLP